MIINSRLAAAGGILRFSEPRNAAERRINHVKKEIAFLSHLARCSGGAVAAGISYYLKLKSFNDELDQDFHEYEEEETPSEETEEKTEPAPERTYITINSGKDTNAADDSVKKEETKDSEETACPEPTDEKDSVKEENVPEEKTSSVVVEDDTEEGKTE